MRRNYYTRFGFNSFPESNREEDISTHEAKSGIIETCGGYIDGYTEYSPLSKKEITIQFDLCDDDQDDLDSEISKWKGLVAKKDELGRMINGFEQRAQARLMSVKAETSYEAASTICHMELTFELISPYWSIGETNITTTISVQGDSSGSGSAVLFDITQQGNVNDTGTIISLSFDRDITGLELAGYHRYATAYRWHLTVSETIPANATLEIDSGRKIARLGTTEGGVTTWTNWYKKIVIGDEHRSMSWIELEAGLRNCIDIYFDLPHLESAYITATIRREQKYR